MSDRSVMKNAIANLLATQPEVPTEGDVPKANYTPPLINMDALQANPSKEKSPLLFDAALKEDGIPSTGSMDVVPFDLSKLQGRTVIRDIGRAGRQTYFLPFNMLRERENFNVRIDLGDIEGLAKSLLENGQKSPITIDLLADPETGGSVGYITDGYRRYNAYKLLVEQGQVIQDVECFVNTVKTTEIDRIALMYISQDNKKLEPIETANCFRRLINLTYTVNDISQKFAKSDTYVRDMLSLADESPAVKQLVLDKKVSASAVIRENKTTKDPVERRKKIEETVKSGKKIPKKKVITTKSKPNTPDFVYTKVVDFKDRLLPYLTDEQTVHDLSILVAYFCGSVSESELMEMSMINGDKWWHGHKEQ